MSAVPDPHRDPDTLGRQLAIFARDTATVTPSTVEQDHETEPEIIETFDRRTTLPPDHDPARVAQLHKLLDITSKKEFKKLNLDTHWEGIKQAKMAFV